MGITDKTTCDKVYFEQAHVDGDLVDLAWETLGSTALSGMVLKWRREIFAVSRDGRRLSGEGKED